ncbi:MAG: outer membrane protein assembly factor BamB [Gammaproteobacteria bacterium RIFCSPHIGHO2_12_FULL_35_23]|nr:MAG: outer membrane protein assembly factor BamB [Gammaproteobacteria bacterium RIFCSPHIGHO2_12_FULL_35_23]
MKRLGLLIICLTLISLLAACGLGTDNTMPPSPLVQFQPTLQTNVLWSHNVGDGNGGYYLRLVPAASNGVIYAGSHKGVVTALDAKTGAVLWQVSVKQSITSGLVAGGGNAIYFGTGNAKLFALSMQNGQVLWKTAVADEILAQPQYVNGTVLVHTLSGNLAAYSAQDGHRIWSFDEDVPSLILHAAGQPQIAGNMVIAGFANGELVVLDINSGQVIWEQHVAYPTGDNPISQMVDITVNPVVVNGVVYAATYQGQIAAYSLDNGQLIWKHKISSYAGITANQSQIFVSDAKSRVWAFDEEAGAVNWRQLQLLGRGITGPVIYNDALVVADSYGYLHFMSLADGHFLARVSIGNGALAQPISYLGNLYVYTSTGTLLAIHSAKK